MLVIYVLCIYTLLQIHQSIAMTETTTNECTVLKLPEHTYHVIFGIKTVVLILAALACSLAIGMMIFFKAYKKFVHRLALYLVIAAFFNSFAFILNSLPAKNSDGYMVLKNGFKGFCIATGFFDHCTKWVILLLVCWITLQIFMLGVLKRNCNSLKYEVTGVVTTLLVSLLISSIPFIKDMYGLTGTWCWIKTTKEIKNTHHSADNKTEKMGYAEQNGLWYGPVLFSVTLNFIAVLAVIVVLYRGTQQTQGSLRRTYKDAFKEALPLLLYPIIFSVIYSLAFVHRIYWRCAKHEDTVVILWAIHAIAESSLLLFIPLAFLLHPNTLKMLKCYQFRKAWNEWRHQSEYSQTHFVVSREAINDEEEERLIITGSKINETTEYKTLKFLEIKPV